MTDASSRSRLRTLAARACVLACLAGVAGCGATTPSGDITTASQFFSDALAPKASSKIFTFTLTASSTANVMLGSVTSAATGEPSTAMLTMTLGTSSGSTCTATSSKTIASSLTAQIVSTLSAGTYCVTVSDPGNLTETSNFTVRVTTTTGTPTASLSTTDQLPTTLAKGGTSIKTFTAADSGALQVTLTAVAADPTLEIELGVGVWDGAVCRLNTSLVTASGTMPQIETNVDAGVYCIRLADVGNLTGQVATSGTILHP